MRRRLDLYTYFKLLLDHKEEIQAHKQEDQLFRLKDVSGIYLGHGLCGNVGAQCTSKASDLLTVWLEKYFRRSTEQLTAFPFKGGRKSYMGVAHKYTTDLPAGKERWKFIEWVVKRHAEGVEPPLPSSNPTIKETD